MKRTILVTGANRGIGFSIARKLAQKGNLVFLGSRNIKAGEEAAEILQHSGLDVIATHMDLNDSNSIDTSLVRIENKGYLIDTLINNAGVLYEKTLLELTDDQMEETISVNLKGPIRLIRSIAPGMIKKGYGRIVNISSNWGSFAEKMGGPGVYGITKAGLNALTMRLAIELPSTVKVNSMCPGWVRTRMGGENATRSPDEAADTAVWLATLSEDGPTGCFFRDRKPMEW